MAKIIGSVVGVIKGLLIEHTGFHKMQHKINRIGRRSIKNLFVSVVKFRKQSSIAP